MKCKVCKQRMQSVLTSYVFNIDGRSINVINVPSEQCSVCKEVRTFDLILENARRYADVCNQPIVDYRKCEDEENTNLIVTQMLW